MTITMRRTMGRIPAAVQISILAALLMLIAALPLRGQSVVAHWVIYMIVSGHWSVTQGVTYVLFALPAWVLAFPGIKALVADAVAFVVSVAVDYGMAAVPAAIAAAFASGPLGWVLLIVGAGTLA